jgi:gamma-glutamylputrescine oxidase
VGSQPKNRRDWGTPPWRRGRPLSTKPIPSIVDVAIVGAGGTGLSTAYHLARAGVRPIVLEADTSGSGASGRTGGIVLEGISSGPRDGARDCLLRLETLVNALEIDCDLRVVGCWEIEHQEGRGSTALPWTDEGAPVRIAEIVPGGSVEPGALTAGLADAAIKAGALIFEHQRVKGIERGRRLRVVFEDGEIEAPYGVLAVNAWTADLAMDLGEIHSALTYACVTEPLDAETLKQIGLADRIPFYTADTPYLWGRVCPDGAVVFGAGLSFGEPSELEATRITGSESASILQRMTQRVRSLNPALARINIRSGWAGPIAFRRGGVPLLTRCPDVPNLLIAGAYAGHGVAFSIHAGWMLAEAILHDAPLPNWGRPSL